LNERFSWRDFDWPLLIATMVISGLGVLEVYSATRSTPLQDVYLRQILWICVGLILLWIASSIDYHWLVQQTPTLYVFTLAGLVAVLMFAPVINGARRWLVIPGIPNLQISEFAKVMLVLLAARLFADLPQGRLDFRSLTKACVIFCIPLVLVLQQPALSTSLSYLAILGAGIFLAGLPKKYIVIGLIGAALAAPVGWFLLSDYQKDRVTSFMDPEADPRGKGYQALQSKIAVGSGGIWGQGFAHGTQTQLRFLPEAHTDFVFASYAEESGFVGVLIALALYFGLLMRIVHNAQTAADPAGMQICMAVAALLLFQITVNVGMVVNKMPVTGMPLPLMSYGGSNTLTVFMLLGLVNNVRIRRFTN
jgi:rod shape determining protein RodA